MKLFPPPGAFFGGISHVTKAWNGPVSDGITIPVNGQLPVHGYDVGRNFCDPQACYGAPTLHINYLSQSTLFCLFCFNFSGDKESARLLL